MSIVQYLQHGRAQLTLTKTPPNWLTSPYCWTLWSVTAIETEEKRFFFKLKDISLWLAKNSSLKCFHINTSTESSYELLSISFAHSERMQKSRVFDCIFSHHLLRAGRVWKFCEKINDLAFVVLQITVAVAFFCLCREKRKICEEEFMKIAQTTQNDVPTCVRKWETALAAFNYVHMEGGREKSLKFNCQFVVHSFQQMTSLLSRRSSLVQMSGGIWRERKWWILKKNYKKKFADRRESVAVISNFLSLDLLLAHDKAREALRGERRIKNFQVIYFMCVVKFMFIPLRKWVRKVWMLLCLVTTCKLTLIISHIQFTFINIAYLHLESVFSVFVSCVSNQFALSSLFCSTNNNSNNRTQFGQIWAFRDSMEARSMLMQS